jgi:hypothetical protein
MNSRLQLESQIDVGSTYFDLEVQTSNEPTKKIAYLKPILMPAKTRLLKKSLNKKIKIMIVEDNKVNMLLLKTILKNLEIHPTFLRFLMEKTL